MIQKNIAIAAVALVLASGTSVHAETLDEFTDRVRQAFAGPDRTAALKALFFMDDMDAETKAMYEGRIIGRILERYDAPTVTLEPLPAGFEGVQVGNGYEYRPNLAPLGYVVLNGKTRVVYGRHNGRFYFSGMIRTPIENPAGPERVLQMIVMAFASPPIRFDGFCQVLLANHTKKRVLLADDGMTSRTMLVSGVRIESCELRNLSGRGGMMLRLLEGDDQLFEQRIEHPERAISFSR